MRKVKKEKSKKKILEKFKKKIVKKMNLPRHLTTTLTGHIGPVHVVINSKDGQYALSCSADRSIKVKLFFKNVFKVFVFLMALDSYGTQQQVCV